MKYDILVQTFTSVHPILSVYIFGSKTIFAKKKNPTFLGYYKTKKKVAWTTKPLG